MVYFFDIDDQILKSEPITFALQQFTATKPPVYKNNKAKCICDVIYYAKQEIYCKIDTIYCKVDTIYFSSSTIPSCEARKRSI